MIVLNFRFIIFNRIGLVVLYCYWIDEKAYFVFIIDNQMFQYFITVVPTKLHTYKISADTHQFSVTERVSGA
jgi:hypothetical protein